MTVNRMEQIAEILDSIEFMEGVLDIEVSNARQAAKDLREYKDQVNKFAEVLREIL